MTGPDSLPVERATVTVTSLNGNITRNARTDKNGRFTIAFPGDEGDYMVSIAALGFTGKRFEIKRTGDQDILVADARLSKSAAQLDAVKVQANRDKPQRDPNASDIGGSERSVNASNVSADALGDLAALAASMPGVQLIPGADGAPAGFSVLGLSPDQNATTLNGMNFGGANIPRDANVSSSLVTSLHTTYRAATSAAGVLNIRTGRASNYIVRTTSANIDAPAAQWTDRAGQALHQQYANVSLGGLFAGPIQPDKSFFNLAYQLGRRQSDLQSLLTTDALGLQTAGISSDSANRLVSNPRPPARSGDRGRRAEQPVQRPGAGVRQHGLHAADVDHRPGVQPDVQRQLEPVDRRDDVAHRAAGAQRRPRVVERRAAGPAHELFRLWHSQRDVDRPERQQQLRHAISR